MFEHNHKKEEKNKHNRKKIHPIVAASFFCKGCRAK